MSPKISRKTNKNQKNKQVNAVCNEVKINQKCAGCNEKTPEYVLDDRQLCVECYRTERNYCDKE